MSKNIVIQEGGSGRQLTAGRLKTNLAEGGACLWVPEDEVKLGKKTLSANGTYLAADDGLYGFSQVTVRGVGTARGKGTDGKRYAVSADEDGNLTYTALAESIRVIAPPEVTSYGDGAYISFEGLRVAACDADGEEMYEIPFEALEFPVTVADEAQAAPSRGNVGDYELNVLPASGWYDDKHYAKGTDYGVAMESSGTIYMLTCRSRYGVNCIWYYSLEPFTIDVYRTYKDGTAPVHNYEVGAYSESTGYYRAMSGGGFSPETITPPLARFYTWDEYEAFNDLLARTKAISDVGGQRVPVRWARPGDGETLETAFDIIVIPAGGHGED